MDELFELPSKGWKAVIRVDITQRELEEFQDVITDFEGTKLHGHSVKAALKVGWIIEPESIDVDTSNPGYIRWMFTNIFKIINEAIVIPPN